MTAHGGRLLVMVDVVCGLQISSCFKCVGRQNCLIHSLGIGGANIGKSQAEVSGASL